MNKLFIKKTLARAYLFLRRNIFGGQGLSRVSWIRNINFAVENFLVGRREFIMTNGATMYLDPASQRSMNFWRKDSISPQMQLLVNFIMSKILEGGTFVDVGAHIGQLAIPVAVKLKQSGNVYAFEPDERGLAYLRKNIAVNGLTNVIIEPKAVSREREREEEGTKRRCSFGMRNMGRE